MLHTTELIGSKTYDAQGHYVGRLRELFIVPAEVPYRVSWYLLSRGRFQPLVARHDQVASLTPGTLRLNCSERALEVYAPNEAWLAVCKAAASCPCRCSWIIRVLTAARA